MILCPLTSYTFFCIEIGKFPDALCFRMRSVIFVWWIFCILQIPNYFFLFFKWLELINTACFPKSETTNIWKSTKTDLRRNSTTMTICSLVLLTLFCVWHILTYSTLWKEFICLYSHMCNQFSLIRPSVAETAWHFLFSLSSLSILGCVLVSFFTFYVYSVVHDKFWCT